MSKHGTPMQSIGFLAPLCSEAAPKLYRPNEVPKVSDEAVAALVKASSSRPGVSASFALFECAADRLQLWRAGDIWAVTLVRNDPNLGCFLQIEMASAAITSPLRISMEEWAKDLGCLSVLSAGVEMAEGDAAGFAPIAVITRKVL